MSKIYTLEEAQNEPPGQKRAWLYNTLDCTGTREIADTLLPRMTPAQFRTYSFSRSLQNPVMDMMMRGVLVDTELRKSLVGELKRELAKQVRKIAKMPLVTDVWDKTEKETGLCPKDPTKHHKWPRGVPDKERTCLRCGASRMRKMPFNANSSDHCSHLFYDLHKHPPMRNKQQKVSTDESVLQRIMEKKGDKLAPLAKEILVVRDYKKQLGTLDARLSSDQRYPSSVNISAAWTDRFSSSKNPLGEGGNLQNVAERHRQCFIADPGYDMAYIDLKQAESNVVAHVAGDEAYIEAHRSGDVHTFVTRLVWPDLPWTWNLETDKPIAKQNPEWDLAPGHDLRFQSKRIQHGSNFLLTPPGISKIAHIPLVQAVRAQRNYFTAFPFIRVWQNSIIKRIKEHQPLINPLGYGTTLLGRPNDPHTHKQGCALIPQSTVARIANIAMRRIWWLYGRDKLRLLMQVHDALLLLYPQGRLDIVREFCKFMMIPVPVTDIEGKTRVMKIEVEVAVGKNWGHYCSQEKADAKKCRYNPYGLKEISLNDE